MNSGFQRGNSPLSAVVVVDGVDAAGQGPCTGAYRLGVGGHGGAERVAGGGGGQACGDVTVLAERGEVTAAQLAAAMPALAEQITVSPGKPYESRQRVCSTVLGVLAAEGRIRRARPAGNWTSARFRWAPAEPLPRRPRADAQAAMARHYLAAFGPVTEADLKWWTG
ncbi:DNA glycosylase AlkZ-like family protein [Streptomyces sp. NPDC048340]|uniref:DNA glycosylase AlkZ-like family protein n=1 Tax=Streptomyces sp. NPDC048340 TaxID=3365537 RepID=UPI00370F9D4E